MQDFGSAPLHHSMYLHVAHMCLTYIEHTTQPSKATSECFYETEQKSVSWQAPFGEPLLTPPLRLLSDAQRVLAGLGRPRVYASTKATFKKKKPTMTCAHRICVLRYNVHTIYIQWCAFHYRESTCGNGEPSSRTDLIKDIAIDSLASLDPFNDKLEKSERRGSFSVWHLDSGMSR